MAARAVDFSQSEQDILMEAYEAVKDQIKKKGNTATVVFTSGALEGDFVNRKSFHSINVQMVCNAVYLISNVVAKWPGSVHDSRVFRSSAIYLHLSQGEFSVILLGDRGYACEPFLLTLYRPHLPG